MIIYNASKEQFVDHVRKNQIVKELQQNFQKQGIFGGSEREVSSWSNSLNFMKNILETPEIPDDCYVAIEYKIPYSSKRIDFLITGHDDKQHKSVVVVELKQWKNARDTNKEDMVETFVGGAKREVLHPSYQANQYKYLLTSFNKPINDGDISCYSCAYLHNAYKDENINLLNVNIYNYLQDSPIFFQEDYDSLQKRIIDMVCKGNGKQILFEIENGEVVPSKKLIDTVGSTIKGNENYLLVDSQKVVFENIMARSNETGNVFIVNGNPGTGKSVVAINLLAKLLEEKKLVVFTAPNASFKNVLKEKIKQYVKETKDKIAFDVLFKGSSIFYDASVDVFDWIIVDEAHRLKGKGTYQYKGVNQVEDIIKASKNVVFFIDEKQRIRTNDVGTNENIIECAKKYNKNIFNGPDYFLETQFRCSGAEGYINSLDTTLQIKETGNFYLDDNDTYEFKICDSPNEMEALIDQRIEEGYKDSVILAGYAWEWKNQKKNLDEMVLNNDPDISFPEHNWSIYWNYNDPKMLWALKANEYGFKQAGCIHTTQGLEFDYCGVIIGPDLKIDDNGKLYGDKENYFDYDRRFIKDVDTLTSLIKNIYKILLTRAQRGTYVYICDDKLREYMKKHLKSSMVKLDLE